MARNIRKSKVKRMRPIFFVFCEGETEVAYVNYLKSKYRLPVEIIPKKSDSNISCRYIENCKKSYFTTTSDKTLWGCRGVYPPLHPAQTRGRTSRVCSG